MRRGLAAAGLGALSLISGAGCTTPPFDTPRSQSSVTMGDVWPDAPDDTPVLLPQSIPPYRVKGPGGIPIDLPDNAQRVDVASSTLHVSLRNRLKLTVSLTFYLAKSNPYAAENKLGTVTVEPGKDAQFDATFDPQILKGDKIYAGVEADVSQSKGLVVTVNKRDFLSAVSWATVQVKIF